MSSGAVLWKILLWQLKGSYSIREGGFKFIPNYEFNSICNIDDNIIAGEAESEQNSDLVDDDGRKPRVSVRDIAQLAIARRSSLLAPGENSMEATTALLMEMKIKAGADIFEEDYYFGMDEGNGDEYENEDGEDNENNEEMLNDSRAPPNRPNETSSDDYGRQAR